MLEWCEWDDAAFRFGLLCITFLGNLESVFELDDDDENEDNKADDEEDWGEGEGATGGVVAPENEGVLGCVIFDEPKPLLLIVF